MLLYVFRILDDIIIKLMSNFHWNVFYFLPKLKDLVLQNEMAGHMDIAYA